MNSKVPSIVLVAVGVAIFALWMQGGFEIFWNALRDGLSGNPAAANPQNGDDGSLTRGGSDAGKGVGDSGRIVNRPDAPSDNPNGDKAGIDTRHVYDVQTHLEYAIAQGADVQAGSMDTACSGSRQKVTLKGNPDIVYCMRYNDLIPVGGGYASDMRTSGTWGFTTDTGVAYADSASRVDAFR